MMEKIVIRGGHSEDIAFLRACCSILFPECKIQILSSGIEDTGDAPVAIETAAAG